MRKITDKDFKYTNASETNKPGYLMEKFKRISPGCFDKRPPEIVRPVVAFIKRNLK